jgi:hypothetical protein
MDESVTVTAWCRWMLPMLFWDETGPNSWGAKLRKWLSKPLNPVQMHLNLIFTSLAATMARWYERGVNHGGIIYLHEWTKGCEEGSNLFCACQLRLRPRAVINHRLLVHSKWCKTEKKEKREPSRVVGRASHYSIRMLLAKAAMR